MSTDLMTRAGWLFIASALLAAALPATAQNAVPDRELFSVVLVNNLNVAACQRMESLLPMMVDCQPVVAVFAKLPNGTAVRFVISYLDASGNTQSVTQTVNAGAGAITANGVTKASPTYSGQADYAFYPGADFTLHSITATLLVSAGSAKVDIDQ
jgi:hypothetical protein